MADDIKTWIANAIVKHDAEHGAEYMRERSGGFVQLLKFNTFRKGSDDHTQIQGEVGDRTHHIHVRFDVEATDEFEASQYNVPGESLTSQARHVFRLEKFHFDLSAPRRKQLPPRGPSMSRTNSKASIRSADRSRTGSRMDNVNAREDQWELELPEVSLFVSKWTVCSGSRDDPVFHQNTRDVGRAQGDGDVQRVLRKWWFGESHSEPALSHPNVDDEEEENLPELSANDLPGGLIPMSTYLNRLLIPPSGGSRKAIPDWLFDVSADDRAELDQISYFGLDAVAEAEVGEETEVKKEQRRSEAGPSTASTNRRRNGTEIAQRNTDKDNGNDSDTDDHNDNDNDDALSWSNSPTPAKKRKTNVERRSPSPAAHSPTPSYRATNDLSAINPSRRSQDVEESVEVPIPPRPPTPSQMSDARAVRDDAPESFYPRPDREPSSTPAVLRRATKAGVLPDLTVTPDNSQSGAAFNKGDGRNGNMNGNGNGNGDRDDVRGFSHPASSGASSMIIKSKPSKIRKNRHSLGSRQIRSAVEEHHENQERRWSPPASPPLFETGPGLSNADAVDEEMGSGPGPTQAQTQAQGLVLESGTMGMGMTLSYSLIAPPPGQGRRRGEDDDDDDDESENGSSSGSGSGNGSGGEEDIEVGHEGSENGSDGSDSGSESESEREHVPEENNGRYNRTDEDVPKNRTRSRNSNGSGSGPGEVFPGGEHNDVEGDQGEGRHEAEEAKVEEIMEDIGETTTSDHSRERPKGKRVARRGRPSYGSQGARDERQSSIDQPEPIAPLPVLLTPSLAPSGHVDSTRIDLPHSRETGETPSDTQIAVHASAQGLTDSLESTRTNGTEISTSTSKSSPSNTADKSHATSAFASTSDPSDPSDPSPARGGGGKTRTNETASASAPEGQRPIPTRGKQTSWINIRAEVGVGKDVKEPTPSMSQSFEGDISLSRYAGLTGDEGDAAAAAEDEGQAGVAGAEGSRVGKDAEPGPDLQAQPQSQERKERRGDGNILVAESLESKASECSSGGARRRQDDESMVAAQANKVLPNSTRVVRSSWPQEEEDENEAGTTGLGASVSRTKHATSRATPRKTGSGHGKSPAAMVASASVVDELSSSGKQGLNERVHDVIATKESEMELEEPIESDRGRNRNGSMSLGRRLEDDSNTIPMDDVPSKRIKTAHPDIAHKSVPLSAVTEQPDIRDPVRRKSIEPDKPHKHGQRNEANHPGDAHTFGRPIEHRVQIPLPSRESLPLRRSLGGTSVSASSTSNPAAAPVSTNIAGTNEQSTKLMSPRHTNSGYGRGHEQEYEHQHEEGHWHQLPHQTDVFNQPIKGQRRPLHTQSPSKVPIGVQHVRPKRSKIPREPLLGGFTLDLKIPFGVDGDWVERQVQEVKELRRAQGLL